MFVKRMAIKIYKKGVTDIVISKTVFFSENSVEIKISIHHYLRESRYCLVSELSYMEI